MSIDNNQTIWRLFQNHEFHSLQENEVTIDCLMNLYFEGAKIIYILHGSVLIGIITKNELLLTLKNREVVYNKNFTKVFSGSNEYEEAAKVFSQKGAIIRNVPVINQNGDLLYEYRMAYDDPNDVKKFYENMTIDYGLNEKENRERKIIISVTSYGKRLQDAHLTIKSIMYQTMKADKIILYVDEDSRDYISEQLRGLCDKGLTIVEGVENIRVHKKYFYTMKDYPDDLIITIDDDAFYEDTFIENLYQSYKQYPKAVSYYRTHRMLQKNGKIEPYSNWLLRDNTLDEPTFSLFGTGVGGGIYPPYSMDERLLDLDLLKKLAFYQDDIWLKYMQLLKGTKVRHVHGKLNRVIAIPGSQDISCMTLNVDGGWNDICIERLSKYFNINLADFC